MLANNQSANHRRRQLRRQRHSSDYADEPYYQPSLSERPYHSPSSQTQNRSGSLHQQVPLFTPPLQNRYASIPGEGPALAPLSFERTADTPQQPLPSLRSLNAGLLPPTPGIPLHPQSQLGASQEINSANQPSSLIYSRAPSHTPASSTGTSLPPYRYNQRLSATQDSRLPPIQGATRMSEAEIRTRNIVANMPYDGLSSSAGMSPYAGGSSSNRRESPARFEDFGRSNKRRKLDSDKISSPVHKAFQYGRYGQVEPGALKMEIASCDGGLYTDGLSHAQENILKADDSVYCTKSNRCNIVLQHQGNTTFSLKELIIRAPTRNYSSPVQQGVVFLSMSKDELIEKNQYHSESHPFVNDLQVHSPTTSLFDQINSFRQRAAAHLNGSGGQDENSGIESQNDIPEELYRLALNRSMTTNAPSARIARNQRNARSTRDAQNSSASLRDDIEAELDNAVDAPRFYLVTEHSDDDEDVTSTRPGHERGSGWRPAPSRWSPTPLHLRNQQRRQVAYDNDTTSDNWGLSSNYPGDDDDDTELFDLGDALMSSPDSGPSGGEPLRSWRPAHLPREFYVPTGLLRDVRESLTPPSIFGGRSHDPDHSANQALPDAKFHMEMYHNKCTIRFNPPVSARYILLKMWNPNSNINGNIDIQGIVAKGFAGPRFFPVKELL